MEGVYGASAGRSEYHDTSCVKNFLAEMASAELLFGRVDLFQTFGVVCTSYSVFTLTMWTVSDCTNLPGQTTTGVHVCGSHHSPIAPPSR